MINLLDSWLVSIIYRLAELYKLLAPINDLASLEITLKHFFQITEFLYSIRKILLYKIPDF